MSRPDSDSPHYPSSPGSLSDDSQEAGSVQHGISTLTVTDQTDRNPHEAEDPTTMQLDANEIVVAHNLSESNDSTPILPPQGPAASRDESEDFLPPADDYEAMKEVIYAPVPEEPLNVLDHVVSTWEIQGWRDLSKKEHGPIFMAGGYPWRILLFPFGNNVDKCSIYIEHGFNTEGQPEMPDDWSCCVQFGLAIWSPTNPSIHHHHAAHHRFTKEEGDWGFTYFLELRKMFNTPWPGCDRPLVQNDAVNITAYVKIVEDETGVLWHSLENYDSKKETGLVGLKNQGATCYLNSLLQSLFFTNSFRKAVYQIPTDTEESLENSAYTLQRLFYQLQTSPNAVDTRELTRSFGWDTRHVFEQQDVQELSRKLMEMLETKMKGTRVENVLPDLFSGKLRTFVKCISVNYESSRIEDFWDIQLNVSGLENLENSFGDYIQVEKLEGENQYYAGEEHKHQDANKGVIFTSFPDVLHLQLKRFQYDFERDVMTKVNDRWEYPETFDASPFLSSDADRSESWEYQLHGVLVHVGDLNAGHYYAFIKPQKNGWFYKFDDDKVTKARKAEVLEDNFGGKYRFLRMGPLRNAKCQKTIGQKSAYMLVYIRKSRTDRVLKPVVESDIPTHLLQCFEREVAEKERIRREREEQHLYLTVKVAMMKTFKKYGGFDITDFVADLQEDEGAPHRYRVLRNTTMDGFFDHLAKDMGMDKRKLRVWVMVNRQNRTTRPAEPVMDFRPTLEDVMRQSSTTRGPSLRLWIEEAEEVDEEGHGVWPTYQTASSAIHKPNPLILLFLKCFDAESQTLRGVGTFYISPDKKVDDMVPIIRQKMGWSERTSGEEKVLLWEEIKPSMIETLKPKQTLKAAELQDGDIICFQRTAEKKANPLSKLGLSDRSHESLVPDRYEDGRDFYDYLYHRRRINIIPHPTRNTNPSELPYLDMEFNTRMPYEQFASKVGEELGVEGSHLRFYTVNASSGNPKLPVKRMSPNSATLLGILSPPGIYGQINAQKSDALFYEKLEMTLTELETKKVIPVTWLSDGISKEDKYDLLVNKVGTVEDLIEVLIKKAGLASEEEAGLIRVYEISNYKYSKDLPRNYQVVAINEYKSVIAERIPEEEAQTEEGFLISVFHFHNEPSRPHGMPFRFLVLEEEPFSETKKRLEKRTGFKGKSFDKIKFAVVRRPHYSKAQYLQDDDILCDIATTDDDFLALDHPDRSGKSRSAAIDLTLK